jgi:hypothetical protein
MTRNEMMNIEILNPKLYYNLKILLVMTRKPTVTNLTQLQRTVSLLRALQIDEFLPVPLNEAIVQESGLGIIRISGKIMILMD